MAQAKVTGALTFERHAYLGRNGGRRQFARHDQTNQAIQAQLLAGVADYAARRLGGKALAPAGLVDQVGQLNLGLPVNGPGQEPASAQKRTATALDCGPKPEFRTIRVALQEPLQFFPGFFEGECPFWKVRTHLRIAV